MLLQQGQLVGPYQIIEGLGHGGMASVYRAHHARLDREVALKMMHESLLQDESFRTRFEREAKIVARLDHPHIVPVYDYSEFHGQPYLVMKLIQGATLKAKLAAGLPSHEETLRIMTAIAGALDHAHQIGVLHRDVKPSNILIDSSGHPYLSDFGLARILQAGETTMSQGHILGTPYYMSPEQALGKGGLDWRSDLYSFAVVLYEMLVGRVPFRAETAYAIIHDHIHRTLPLPRAINPSLNSHVESVLLKALSKERADRYTTAAEIMAELRQGLAVDDGGATLKLDAPPTAQTVVIYSTQPASWDNRDDYTAFLQENLGAPFTADPEGTGIDRKSRPRIALAAVVLVLLVGAAVAVGSLGERMAMTAARPTPLPTTLYDVPRQSVGEARAALEEEPGELAYLSLARALFLAGRPAEARETLEDGYAVADDKLRYILSGARAIAEDGQTGAALVLYDRAVLEAMRQPDRLSAVRAEVGEAMYTLASEPRALGRVELQVIARGGTGANSALFHAMVARAFLTSNLPAGAREALERSFGQEDLAEAHLVQGELFAMQGDSVRAAEEWQRAMAAPDAPAWLVARATALLGTTD